MDNVEFQFSLVIGRDIGEELCNFRNNKSCNTRIVEKILHYYKNYPIFTTSALMQKYYYDFPTILNAVLSNVITPRINIDNSSEKDIAKHTIYKVVLCNDENKNIFPYIYICGDKIENNFTATFLSRESRQKAIDHLKDLLSNAVKILVYDNYLLQPDRNGQFNNWQSFIQFCSLLLPRKSLNIKYLQQISLARNNSNYTIYQNSQQDIANICQNWSWSIVSTQPNTYSHDRYLIINNGHSKIEIIFTSGICHLMNNSKDFTYIVRRHKQ